MAIRILHIIEDSKFLDYCKLTYEVNDYINTYSTFQNVALESLSSSFDIIILHYLKPEYKVLFEENIFPTNRIIWTLWGADGFSLGKFFNKHLLPKTRYARLETSFRQSFIFGVKISVKSLFPQLFDLQAQNSEVISIINKVKYINVLMPNDGIELKINYATNAIFNHLNYLDPIFSDLTNTFKFNKGNNVLVGNSSAFTNNHIDALKIIKGFNIENYQFIIPLNYGDKIYGDIVEEYSDKNFNGKVTCLRDFLKFEDYVQLLETCEIALMPHIRQQAIGNIVKLLLQGANIYFHPCSSIFAFLKESDFIVSDFTKCKSLRKLSFEEKKINQDLALTLFGKKNIHSKVTNIISLVLINSSER